MRDNKNTRLDPDVRFLLANERTLLAWIRTSIGFIAGGIALTQLHRTTGHSIFGIIIVLLGALMACIGYHRYIVADRSIRKHRLPHRGTGPAIQVITVLVVAIVLAIAAIVSI